LKKEKGKEGKEEDLVSTCGKLDMEILVGFICKLVVENSFRRSTC